MYIILTAAAVGGMEQIHDRIPVIMKKNEIVKWIRDFDFCKEVLNRGGQSLELRKVG